ncbi:MAG TPA: hypothetical protein VJ999_00075 [Candidatus Sulfotelmatobacter sp.]|nr:hypothetical protein [Candidatus Sulfotelmatobacter sp.]
MFRYLPLVLALALALSLPAFAQQSDPQDKPFDVRSSLGDLHVGKDADAQRAGLPLYPGARPKHEDDNDPLNFGILTESFGMKLIVAKYESDDPPAKVIDFYRGKLKKFGKVLECHSQKHGGDVEAHDDKDSNDSKELKCEENSGPVTELKVGTEDHQHLVAIEPSDSGKGTAFALVYVHTRGKRGEI